MSLTEFAPDKLEIRGVPIDAMIHSMSFVESLIFTLTGHNPAPTVVSMLNALLVAWVDHGSEPPSTQNVRNVAAVRLGFAQACIAGLATFGGSHVPIEQAARFLQELAKRKGGEQISLCRQFAKVPGLGHPVHAQDPRVSPLMKLATHNLESFVHIQALHDAEEIIETVFEKDPAPRANLAGITAAIWLDLGFELDCVGLIPVLGRTVGWAAHFADQRSLPVFAGSVPSFAQP